MNINDFQNLSREEQFAEAGRIAGTEPSVFDGIWRTESGRGANMFGPVLRDGDRAEGHFGLKGSTRKVMEGRFGQPIDPHNFGQSLFTSAHLMQENGKRWSKLEDRLRAYNSGWLPELWNNPETNAYVGKVMGTDEDEEKAYVAGDRTDSSMAYASATTMWDTPFHAVAKAAPTAKLSKVSKALAEVLPAVSAPVQAPQAVIFGAISKDAAQATTQLDREKREATLLEMSRAAAYHEPFNATARWLFRDDEPVDPKFVANEAMMKGKTKHEQQDLRSATSQKQFDRMMFDQEYARDAGSLAFKHGTAWGLGASLIAELPAAFISGYGAMGVTRAAGVGSVALANEGRFGAAMVASTVEGIVGNTATTALLDSIGERQGATAYAMGVAGGLLNPLLMGKGLGRAADRVAERATAARLLSEAAAKEEALLVRARERVGQDAPVEDVRAAMDAIEAEGVRADISSHSAAIPESRRLLVGDEQDVTPDVLPESAAAPEVKAAVEAEDAALVAKVESAARRDVLDKVASDRAYNEYLRAVQSQADRAGVVRRNKEWRVKDRAKWDHDRRMDELEAAAKAKAAASAAHLQMATAGADAATAARKAADKAKGELDVATWRATLGAPLVEATDALPMATTLPGLAPIRDVLADIPEAAPALKALDEAVPEATVAPKVAPVPEVSPALPLAEATIKGPQLGRAKGQGELYPLTPSEKKAIAAARAKANAEAMVEVPSGGPRNAGQSELDFDGAGRPPLAAPRGPLSKTQQMVKDIHGKSVTEVGEWAVKNAPPALAAIAQRALAQLRLLEREGMLVGKVTVTKEGHQLVDGNIGVMTLSATGGGGLNNSPSIVSIKLNHPSNGPRSGVVPETIVHELFHAATTATILLGKRLSAAGTALGTAVDDLMTLHGDLIKHINARIALGEGQLTPFEQAVYSRSNNAMANERESLTWALTNREMQDYLETVPYKATTMWSEFVRGVRSMLGMSPTQDTMLSAYLRMGDRFTSLGADELGAAKTMTGADFSTNNGFGKQMPQALADDVRAFMLDPVAIKHGLDLLPMATPAERAEAKQILALYKKADSPEYVVDEKRLSWLLQHAPAFSPTSNIMLRSKNPVVRMAAMELLENGGGAGGRRSTASIAKYMNERAIIGNVIVDMDQHFNTWFKTQPGASHLNEGLNGTKRSQFSRLIAEEIEQRKPGRQRTDFGQSVRDAADAVEASFERARLLQINSKTVGWAALPDTSVGYMPHRIKSATYRSLSDSQVRALHGELTEQFINGSGFDPSFADQLASRYLDRVGQRALGGFDSPMGLHQTGASDVIREALEAAQMTRPEIDAVMKRYAAGGAGHTKKRLNLDLSKEITTSDGKTFRLMDLYDTDMLSLVRSQSQRVSGEVALARHGVMGKPGLAVLRRAMGYGGQAERVRVDGQEIGAFDQVSAEFLGSPFGNATKNVDRAVQLNSLMSLGGMGFNQFAEIINHGATLGVKSALQTVTGFGRLRAEILQLAKGQKVNNGLLTHIEQMGGAEFGTDAYKMVFPLDNPDLFANSLGADSLHAGDRILRGAGHLQSKLSLWRSIHSVQVRGVAEQIVMKAGRAMKDGVNDFHLRDMGMTDDMFARLKADMPNIAKYQGGKLVEFDITKATDKEAAHAFIQGVHRGASQIIQGAFIGETGKYVHNSWLRMMMQFRSFSLTAIDKQFNRQLGNRGIMGTVFLTIGAMSVAAPIYMARTYLASVGRADQQEYLDRRLSYGAIARATTNYIATSWLAGDFLDAITAVTGTGESTGGRSGTNSKFIGTLLAPVAGKVDKLWGAVQDTQDGTDVHGLLKELSNLPWLIPAINTLGD